MPVTTPEPTVTAPPAPMLPAPLSTTEPWVIASALKVLAAERLRVLFPTFVRVKAPLMAPLIVILPRALPPLVALIQSEPTLELAPRATGLLSEAMPAAVLMRDPRELRAPVKFVRPTPLSWMNSAVVWPLRSSTAPEATVVPSADIDVAAPRPPAVPNLTTPAEMVMGPSSPALLSVSRNRVLVPDLVKVEPAAASMTPSVRSP